MFPFGGGSGYSFNGLAQAVAKDVEVVVINPPGHFMDTSQPLDRIEDMVSLYINQLRPVLKDGCVLFGHSIGSIVAYEMCKILERRVNIKKIIISSVNPPHCISATLDMASDMSREELLSKSETMGGMPRIFQEEPSMLERFVSGLRADLKALEKYIAARTSDNIPPKLNTSAVILYGTDDYIVDLDQVRLWQDYLDCSEFIGFPGSHFHLLEEPGLSAVAEALNRELNRS